MAPLRTNNGYKVSGWFNQEDRLVLLEVGAPKFQGQKPPVLVTCPDCGMRHMKGDADDGISHRAEHRKWMAVLDPKPDRRAVEAMAAGWYGGVDERSPRWMFDAVHARARAFKREMRFDFVQWSPTADREPGTRGFLFLAPDGAMVGAACFRRQGPQSGPERWKLDWIWLARRVRRSGYLSRRWPAFLKEFGAFDLEQPLSKAMEAFVTKHGNPAAQPTDVSAVHQQQEGSAG